MRRRFSRLSLLTKVMLSTSVAITVLFAVTGQIVLSHITQTMSQSLEAREPFLDYHLVEYTLGLPLELKLKNWDPKYVFKQAMRELVPGAIVDRPKQPFAAPIEDWLRQGLGGFARRVILESHLRERGLFRYDAIEKILGEHEQGKADHGVQIWTLMNLSAWYDHWIW